MKRITGLRGFIILSFLFIIGTPDVARSESFETDVGMFNVKESTNDVLFTGEQTMYVSTKSYEVNANIDFVVPKIKHNKIGFNKVGSTLATIALPVQTCGCRGSPIHI